MHLTLNGSRDDDLKQILDGLAFSDALVRADLAWYLILLLRYHELRKFLLISRIPTLGGS
jgi:hypothetical protein